MPEPTASSDTEERILEAALHVFSSKGKDGARTQEIADRAGINKALLHYYFRSKDRLYDRVFEYMLSRLTQSFGTSLQQAATFDDLLRVFIDRYITFVGDNLPIMKLMVLEHLAGGQRMAERLKLIVERVDSPPRIFLDRIRDAGASGEIRRVDPYQALVTTLSACIFFFLILPSIKAIAPAAAQDPDRFVRERKAHVYEVMSSWLRPAASPENSRPSA